MYPTSTSGCCIKKGIHTLLVGAKHICLETLQMEVAVPLSFRTSITWLKTSRGAACFREAQTDAHTHLCGFVGGRDLAGRHIHVDLAQEIPGQGAQCVVHFFDQLPRCVTQCHEAILNKLNKDGKFMDR